jgi:hypothetical protein
MTQVTKQGQYLSRVIRVSTTINPETEAELAQKWQELLAEHGSQSAALKHLIRNADTK